MGHTLSLPPLDGLSLAFRFNRWVDQWSQGGVERYSFRSATAWMPGVRARVGARAREGLCGQVEVTQRRIWLAALPEAFRGFRIVHLTDIHHGLYMSLERVAEIVELANRLEPDLVALTGDFVTYSRAYVEPLAALLADLRPRHGAFAVLGNHDYRVGADHVSSTLREAGITVLRNAHTAFRRRGQALYVAGIDDHGYGADLSQALRGVPAGAATILLAHNPRIVRRAARYGVSLVLSGHTHGGQVNLPVVGTIYGRTQEMRFKLGWDRLGATQIYVSRGLGTVVLPVRVRCPAEIPHLELCPQVWARASWLHALPVPKPRIAVAHARASFLGG